MKTCLFSINKLLSSQISNKFLCVHNKSIDILFCFSSDCTILKVRRSLLIQDMISKFKDSKIIEKKLKLVVTSLNGQEELGDNFGGVLRYILLAFWSDRRYRDGSTFAPRIWSNRMDCDSPHYCKRL